MAFFDKLSEVAKNIGEKTNDAIETGKLSSKISSEKSAAEAEIQKIGVFYYEQFLQGIEVAEEISEYCNKAKEHYSAAEEAQAEIKKIKSEGLNSQTAASLHSLIKCPTCGMENDSGTKFCGSCGTKLSELKNPSRKCVNCGTQVAENIKFCPDCGQKMEG